MAGQVAAMWNHARLMEIKGHRQAPPLPALTGSEFTAIAAYLAGLGSGPPEGEVTQSALRLPAGRESLLDPVRVS